MEVRFSIYLKEMILIYDDLAPFGDFGYGGRFSGHPSDFFPPGHMGFLGPHPGLLPSMEQPLPMSSSLGSISQDQFSMSGDTKPVLGNMADMTFNMAAAKAMSDGSFMSGMEMSRLQQDMGPGGGHPQEFGSGRLPFTKYYYYNIYSLHIYLIYIVHIVQSMSTSEVFCC